MSTSGLIGGTSGAQIKASAQQVAVRLLNAPDALQNNRQTLRIEGIVAGRGPDKTLLVKTNYGEITVQARGAFRAREGQNIQIDVPPGNGARDTVLRPSIQRSDIVDLAAQKQETPSLLKAVADKLISLSRKADIAGSVITQAQQTITGKESLLKTADLTAGTAIRLSPLSVKAGDLLIPIPTQLKSLSGSGAALTSIPSVVMPLSVPLSSIQGQPIQNLSFSRGALFQSVFGANGQQQTVNQNSITSTVLPSTVGQGSIQSGQSVNFPFASNGQVASFDGKVLQGLGNNLQSTLVLNQFSAQPTLAGQFLLNGQAGAVSFQVVGHTPNQQPIVAPLFATVSGRTPNPIPSFAVQFPTNTLNSGSVVTLQPLGWGQFTGQSFFAVDPFSSLAQSIKELQTTNPALSNALSTLTPSVAQPAQRAGSAMLFLFAALQGGSLQNWAGNGADKLSAQHKILQTLEQSLKDAMTPKLVQNTPTGDWRAYTLPMQNQDTMVPISLYVQDNPHRQNQEDHHGDDQKNEVTRFVFEFDLTRMGEIQVDGLMREKNVDIFIRTNRELGADMKKMVRNVYLNALERSDLTGDIAFQSDPLKRVSIEIKKPA